MLKNVTVIILATAVLIFSLLPLCSCTQATDASALMREFCSAYGVSPTVYSPMVREGEEGYVKEDFFFSLYGEEPYAVRDFALVLLSDLDSIFECGVFVCYNDYDALTVSDMLERRIELIREVAASSGLKYPKDAFVMRENRCVVMAVLPDAEHARRIWKRII